RISAACRPSWSSSFRYGGTSAMRGTRRAAILSLGALLALYVAFGLRPALGRITTDFANYYVPARAAVEGRDLGRLYERDAFDREMRRSGLSGMGSFVPHPPPNALLLLPVAALP